MSNSDERIRTEGERAWEREGESRQRAVSRRAGRRLPMQSGSASARVLVVEAGEFQPGRHRRRVKRTAGGEKSERARQKMSHATTPRRATEESRG